MGMGNTHVAIVLCRMGMGAGTKDEPTNSNFAIFSQNKNQNKQ